VEGETCGNLLGAEGAGVFLFVEELDSAHADVIVIEVEFPWVIDGVTELDLLTDIGKGDLIQIALEADGGIVIDDAFVAYEKDLIEFGLGQSPDIDSGQGCVVAVDGPLADAGMELVVVIVLEPQPEGLIELLEGDPLLYPGEEAVADRSEESLMVSLPLET